MPYLKAVLEKTNRKLLCQEKKKIVMYVNIYRSIDRSIYLSILYILENYSGH